LPAARSTGTHVCDERLGPRLAERGLGIESLLLPAVEEVANVGRRVQRRISTAHPKGTGTDDHGDGPAVARDRHLLPAGHAVRNLRQGCPSFADGQCPSHGRRCTVAYG
jgi:hypothetical protein